MPQIDRWTFRQDEYSNFSHRQFGSTGQHPFHLDNSPRQKIIHTKTPVIRLTRGQRTDFKIKKGFYFFLRTLVHPEGACCLSPHLHVKNTTARFVNFNGGRLLSTVFLTSKFTHTFNNGVALPPFCATHYRSIKAQACRRQVFLL